MADIVELSKRVFNEKPTDQISTSAYLLNMAIRLKSMKRILKNTGSIYLHCDPTASHYLKMITDCIFGDDNFRNEITWKRVLGAKSDAGQYGRISDRILFYTKSDSFTFIPPRLDEVNDSWYNKKDSRGRYISRPLTAAGETQGDSGQVWRGIVPTGHWTVPKILVERYENDKRRKLKGSVRERLEILAEEGYIDFSISGLPSWRRYLDEANPPRVHDIWDDDKVKPIARNSIERTGYPTQKPISLMKRIVESSSNKDDIILDPFCGCGTTLHAAEELERQWIGIDISQFSAGLVRNRLLNNFNNLNIGNIPIIGSPLSAIDAENLARRDRFEFEKWACGEVGASGLYHEPGERGADGGVDGIIPFYYSKDLFDNKPPEKTYAIVQVKSGNVQPDNVKALSTTVRESGATCGVFICFNRFMTTVENNREKKRLKDITGNFNFIQGLSVENLIEGNRPRLPPIPFAA